MDRALPMWRQMRRTLALAALLLASAVIAVAPVRAGDWQVRGDLAGKNSGATEDMSGIACATATGFPRHCLLIDDELQAAQMATLTDGEIVPGDLIPLIADTFKGKPVELDGEGAPLPAAIFTSSARMAGRAATRKSPIRPKNKRASQQGVPPAAN
jgi:hypothetical protein